MVASYGGDLAAKHARDFRTVVMSPWFGSVFPATQLVAGGNRIDEQITTANGGRKAISVGGAATGFGADIIVADDMMKVGDAGSVVERQRVKDFYEQTLLSRLNDKAAGRVVIIQQRIHEDDLPGYLIEGGQFVHLNLPAIAVSQEKVPLGFGRHQLRCVGDILCPEREPLEALNRLRIEMGAAAFSAQYQQDPTPPGGNRLRWEWFGTYEEDLPRDDCQWVVQSWDTGFSAEPTSDFSVGTTWGFANERWHLLALERGRFDFPVLKSRIGALADRWAADAVLIEQAGSGISLVQQLRADHRHGARFKGIIPRLDKRTRFEAQTARLETGRYHLPVEAPWLEDFRRELLAFPNGRYDDQVDSMVQFLEWSASSRGRGFVDRDPETGRRWGRRPPALRR